MTIVTADGALLERIFDLTFPIWHEGLTRHAYSQWNRAQMRLPWARGRFDRFALIDDSGQPLASLKRYRYDMRLRGRDGWLTGIGAVFTPPELRGRSYSRTLIEQVLDRERRDGSQMALLFSEIGAAFYERTGFSVVALDECTVRVKVKDGAPAMLVRSGTEQDLAALAALHETRSASSAFTLRRDPQLLAFTLAKKRLFAGLSPPGMRQVEFFVAEEGSTAVAYVVVSQNQYGWTLEEAGDRDPAGARLGAMLQVLVAREPSVRAPLIKTWWPRAFPVPPQLELTDRADAKDLFMVRPLADVEVPRSADDIFYWRSDYF